jgi:hypothetical protein
MISSPRILIIVLGAIFSAYHLVLALYTLSVPANPGPVIVAMLIYAGATLASLWTMKSAVLPTWLAALNVAVGIVVSVLVLSQLDFRNPNGYATWSVAAVSTLMVITMVRRQPFFAWLGVASLAVTVVLWSNPVALTTTGVIGGALWVGVAHAVSAALLRAERDAVQFARAGVQAAEWQSTQEAQLYERRVRLEQMSRLAAPMLRRIVVAGGSLTEDERRECLYLEAAIRDEIRGRLLLSDAVRDEVMAARRRGIQVTVLDDGGIDDLPDAERERALSALADEVRQSTADRLIIRTGAEGSPTAVSIVGVRTTGDGTAAALGTDAADDEVDVWREIPRAE